MTTQHRRPAFKSQARLRMQPKPKPKPAPSFDLPGDVSLTFVNLDTIGMTDDGRLYVGDPDNIVESNAPVAEPQPKHVNVRGTP
ncbi:hypothetical protein [Rhodococcus globerulus]|uniref:hypothetical protein n=1 Tax=Rhodococcus globerulus TaxID=33008 RepID=UPI00301843E0